MKLNQNQIKNSKTKRIKTSLFFQIKLKKSQLNFANKIIRPPADINYFINLNKIFVKYAK